MGLYSEGLNFRANRKLRNAWAYIQGGGGLVLGGVYGM